MIRYKFKGNIPNDEIIKEYTDIQPDCFITLSSTEGLPVSVMEAMGCGVAVIATNVGGVPELINENGVLLSDNPSPEQVADAIVEIAKTEKTRLKMRVASRKLWEEKYDCEKNAKLFSDYIRSIGQINKIVLITEGYPYGGEQSFIEPELRELIRHYDVDIICPVSDELLRNYSHMADEYIKHIKRDQSEEIHDINIIREKYLWNIWKSLPYYISYLYDKRIQAERKSIWQSKKRMLIRYWESMKYYADARLFYYTTLRESLRNLDPSNTLVYTYWHTHRTLAACIYKNKYPGIRILTREHGFDLYDERREKSLRQPFREVMEKELDGVIFACDKGREYYLKRNHVKIDDRKHRVFYLGSKGSKESISTRNDGVFKIVSCSQLIPLKRVNMIIDGLRLARDKMPDRQIEWIHFGDGPLRGEIEEYAEKQLGKATAF